MKGRVGRRCAGLLLLDRAPDDILVGPKGGATYLPRWWALRDADGEVVVIDDAELPEPGPDVEQQVLWPDGRQRRES